MSVTNPFGNIDSLVGGDLLPASEVVNHARDIATTRASRTSFSLAAGNKTLSTAESETVVLEATGTLTANRQIIVPLTAGMRWWVYNATAGAYTVTVIGATGTGIVITQGGAALVWTDGTNVLRATPDTEQDGDLSANTVPASAIGDAVLTGQKAAVLADAAVIGGLPVRHMIAVAAGTTGNVDVPLTYKTRVTNVWLVKRSAAGGGAGTIQVFNGANAISDAMSINVADQTVVRCATLDDAYWEIAAAGTLRVTRTRTASTDETCTVYVDGVRVS